MTRAQPAAALLLAALSLLAMLPPADARQPVQAAPSAAPEVAAAPAATATPTASPGPTFEPSPTPLVLAGTATWYCVPGWSPCPAGIRVDSLSAAAGPELRRALGKAWRGQHVRVCAGKSCVTVRLVDSCADGCESVVDLFGFAWDRLAAAPRSRGEIRVTVALP